jgi:RNA polymerase sigma-70 factor (ECF subfamily)
MAVVTASAPLVLVSDDELLLERSQAGERAALEELFGRYRGVAYRVAFRLLGNEADSLDAVQEAFIKVLTHLDGFEGRSSFKTWLLRVVSNAALDLGRQRGRRENLQRDELPLETDAEASIAVEDPGSELDRADLRRLLDQALAQLPAAQRRTFVLHVDGELSYREVADVLGISIGTVMSRLYYARQKLRALLAEKWPR